MYVSSEIRARSSPPNRPAPQFDSDTSDSDLDAVAWQLDGESDVRPSADVADAEIGANVPGMADVELE